MLDYLIKYKKELIQEFKMKDWSVAEQELKNQLIDLSEFIKENKKC